MNKVAVLEHLGSCMETIKAYLQSLVAEVTQAMAEAVEEVEQLKADKAKAVPAILLPSVWEQDSKNGIEGYPNCYEMEIPGLTAKDRAEITVAPGSLATAGTCGLCLTNQTLEGKIRIWAARIPTEELQIEYWIESGKE